MFYFIFNIYFFRDDLQTHRQIINEYPKLSLNLKQKINLTQKNALKTHIGRALATIDDSINLVCYL